jgi:tryptophan-rich sensory protein
MQQGTASKHGASGHYTHLGIMTTVSFLAMYGLMYAMVDSFSNVFSNLNQLYMAAVMTAAMVIIELVVIAILMCENATLSDPELQSLCTSPGVTRRIRPR